jgi:hypothetical protein
MTTHRVMVDTKSAWASKINWTQAVGAGAMVLAWFGVDMPPDVRAAIVTMIGAGTQVTTWALRTWFTRSVTPGSL